MEQELSIVESIVGLDSLTSVLLDFCLEDHGLDEA